MTFKHLCIAGASAACILSSCVDDKYDLSDIDTTVRVDVNDLTIPVNLDEIRLKSIIKESDRIKIINGEYAVIQEERSFTSTDIKINAFTINSNTFNPTVIDNIPFVPAAANLADAGYFDINCPVQQFQFKAGNIPAEITELKRVGGNLTFHFDFALQGISSVARKVEFRDLTFQLPKGLHVTTSDGSKYNPSTGILTMPSRTVTGENLSLVFAADSADLKILGTELDYDTHSIDVSGDFYVKSGKIVVNRNDIIAGASPTTLKLTINYLIPQINVTAISGRMKYNITGINIPNVDLTDLPDVLSQPGTDIRIVNPQIYLSINNPLQPYKLSAHSGLTISAIHGPQSTSYSIDEPYITVGSDHADGIYKFCISPKDPAKKIEGFDNATHVPFSDLSKVLSGNGMPSSLAITLDDPNFFEQPVENLRLGIGLDDVNGKYSFIAPIALEQGSKIIYADDMDNWDAEDLEDLTVTKLNIKATLTSDIPLALDIRAYPIDKDGNQINNVEIEGAKLAASSDPQDVNISITGTIKGLAGIHFEAVATAGSSQQVLRPDMDIKVTNLRPTVSGYYEKEL